MANSKIPGYNVWKNMRQRCNNPNNQDYRYYGGRGIKVCERWDSFTLFLADMGERPAGLTLDRIDNNGDYEPSNCRWVTMQEQSRNKRQYSNNKSGITGVCWYAPNKKWVASIRTHGKVVWQKYFHSLNEAQRERELAKIRLIV